MATLTRVSPVTTMSRSSGEPATTCPLCHRPQAANPFGRILQASADAFGVRVPQLLLRRGQRAVTLARHVAIHLLSDRLGYSSVHLARLFGHADHTSILNSRRRVLALVRERPGFAALVADTARGAGLIGGGS